MRWVKKEGRKEKELLSKRDIKRFLLFPRCIDNETRWLEFVTISQLWNGIGWVDCSWVDRKIKKFKNIGNNEYRDNVCTNNDYNNDKWNKLKQYIMIEKEKIENSDDIPQSIYADILYKIKELEKT